MLAVIYRLVSVLTAILGLLCVPQARADDRQSRSAKVIVIPIRGPIAEPQLFILRRGLKQAIAQNVDTVILDMETPGGELDVAFEMIKALGKFPGKTITYVNSEAISAGALISAGTDEIYFAPDGVIGSAAPILATGGDIDVTLRSKIVSYLKARIRAVSEGKGYRGEVISAMIDIDSEFKIGNEVIKEKGELLSLTAQEAMKSYGQPSQPLLGKGIVRNQEALLDQIEGPGNYSVQKFEISGAEKLAQYLTTVTPLLLALGLVCLIIELKTPGFGIFGISGIILIGLVFFGQFVAGFSGHEPVVFFLLGLTLLVIELLFFPGVTVLALSGVSLMLGSLVWAMADLWPHEPIPLTGDVFLLPLANVLGAVVLAVMIFLAVLKFLPKGWLWSAMVLDSAVGGELTSARAMIGGGADEPTATALLGEAGFAATSLFPSGQVEIAGRRYEARLAIGYAEVGTPVEVTGIGEFGLIVEVKS
jgi:membrane-bound serine protease (ClpP class)